MLWRLGPFRRSLPPPAVEPAVERAVAERLLPHARDIVVAPGASGASELLDLVVRLAPADRTEIILSANDDTARIDRLLAAGFSVYDGSASLRTSLLVLDRRLGWGLPAWTLLPQPFQTACQLSWTRLGYYTVLSGTVEAVHEANGLFSLVGRPVWVNVAYRDLPQPAVGAALRILGLYSFLGSTVPVFHALRIDPL